jgi:hypothetical protein
VLQRRNSRVSGLRAGAVGGGLNGDFISGIREGGRGGGVVCGRGCQPCVVLIYSGLCDSVEEEEGCLATGESLFLFWFSKVSVWLHVLGCSIVRIGYPSFSFGTV